ncbi:MAG TPA: choice-of-anchor Q domain-containing protein [Segetibacter sp.]|jgi:hypothetical protein
MKRLLTGLALWLVLVTACTKTSFIESAGALVSLSTDTLHFDTVFTTLGSVTQSFKIFNQNNQKLRFSSIQLMGGSSSAFKINVDGTAGENFSNIELEPNDSIYVFVSATINPRAANLPFLVRDSILVQYNGQERFVQLEAFGQNANFLRNRRITRDTTWNNDLPFVILDGVLVDSNATLTINKGCRIYSHANAPFIVNGTLQVNGEADETSRVVFRGDRLDPLYADLPASWPGIYFTSSSKDNVLNYTTIKDAYQGIIAELPATVNRPKLTLNQCIIDNIYDAGITSFASSIKATNCLISNCGTNITFSAGGNYEFDHCTVVSYSNFFINHKSPVLQITNAYQNDIFPLSASFRNCIFYGEGGPVDNEVVVTKKGTPGTNDFRVLFTNVLYQNKNEQPAAVFNNSKREVNPDFLEVETTKRTFNFHLKPTSAAINAGIVTGVTIDLTGKSRGASGLPDLGCYEE